MKTLSDIKNWEEMIGEVMNADCLELMKMLPDKSIDLVIADPPYNLIGLDNFIDLGTYRKWSKLWIEECFRVLKWNGTFILCGRPPVLSYLIVDICEMGKVFREMITWNKIDSITLAREYHSRNYEQFAIFSNWMERTFNYIPIESESKNYGKERNIGSIWSHCKISSHHKEGTEHPTQKPIMFLKRFIETYTNETDLVLDPFMGSFTTAIAAESLGRKWIGCDISEKYCQIGAERLRILRSQPKLIL